MHEKRIVAGYLILQAVGVAAWWGLLIAVPASVAWFQPAAWAAGSLLGFWLADSVLLVAGSCAAALAISYEKSWATIAVWAIAATIWYPTLYCLGVSIMTDEAWVAAGAMSGMAGLTLAMATIYGSATQEPAAIRVTSMGRPAAVGWTLAQVVIFWSVFLWILPKAIVELERRFGIPTFSHGYQSVLAIVLFVAASMLGLLSGMTMAARGEGTPLPTATAPRLVAVGPYRWIRNPMAVAGILQGTAVGWFFGSYCVIAYSVLGGFVWHFFVRPVEEADLEHRFGGSYAEYKNSVGLWIPRFLPRRGQTSSRIGSP